MNRMFNIVKRKFREQSRSVMFYAIGLLAYAWMIIAIFPLFSEDLMMEEYLSVLPEELLAMLGVEDMASMSTIEGFLTLEYLGIFFILILTFFVASSAGSTIAGAIEKRTIDFQLSQPITRMQLLLSEAFVTIAYTVGLVIFNSVAMILLSRLHNVELCASGVLAFTVLASGMMLSIYGIAIVFSSFLKSRSSVMTTTIFLVLAMHIFQSLTIFVERLQDYERTTLFYMYKPEEILRTAQLDLTHMFIFILVFLLGLASAIFVFQRKNLS